MEVSDMHVVNTETNEWNPDNAYVTGVEGLEFHPRLDDSTQYSTVYAGERPVGTLQRRRRIGETGPVWKLYLTDASLVRVWHHAPTYRALARGAFLALQRAGVVRSEVR